MADITVSTNGPRNYIFTVSEIFTDTTNETNVQLVDISTLTDAEGLPATYSIIDSIQYDVFGMNHVVLEWDHTANDRIAVLFGDDEFDWKDFGGNVDPQSAGGTGDILLSTNGVTVGGGYTITVYMRPKA